MDSQRLQEIVEILKDILADAADDLDDGKGACLVQSYNLKEAERALAKLKEVK